jgi:tRNA (Thr-GGU) A37 N-methylase
MSKKLLIVGIFIVLITTKLLTLFSKELEKNIKYENIQKDLKTMEDIFHTFLTEYDNDILPIRNVETSSIYIDGYGVIFITNPSFDTYFRNPLISVINRSTTNIEKPEISIIEKSQKEGKDIEKKREETISALTNAVIEIITDYASALKGLNLNERITVIANIPSEYKNTIEKIYNVEDSQIIITVEKKWLDNYKKGQIGLDALKNQIKNMSKNQYPQKEIYKRINILKSIIISKLEDGINKNISKNQIYGTYVNGLGTIFIINLDRGGLIGFFAVDVGRIYKEAAESIEKSKKELEKAKKQTESALQQMKLELKIIDTTLSSSNEIIGTLLKKSDQKEDKTIEEKVKELTDKISEIFSDFGSTLKEVKSNERIEILIKSQNLGTKDNKVENVQFTINKSDIDDYEKGIIKIDSFKNRIKIKVF